MSNKTLNFNSALFLVEKGNTKGKKYGFDRIKVLLKEGVLAEKEIKAFVNSLEEDKLIDLLPELLKINPLHVLERPCLLGKLSGGDMQQVLAKVLPLLSTHECGSLRLRVGDSWPLEYLAAVDNFVFTNCKSIADYINLDIFIDDFVECLLHLLNTQIPTDNQIQVLIKKLEEKSLIQLYDALLAQGKVHLHPSDVIFWVRNGALALSDSQAGDLFAHSEMSINNAKNLAKDTHFWLKSAKFIATHPTTVKDLLDVWEIGLQNNAPEDEFFQQLQKTVVEDTSVKVSDLSSIFFRCSDFSADLICARIIREKNNCPEENYLFFKETIEICRHIRDWTMNPRRKKVIEFFVEVVDIKTAQQTCSAMPYAWEASELGGFLKKLLEEKFSNLSKMLPKNWLTK